MDGNMFGINKMTREEIKQYFKSEYDIDLPENASLEKDYEYEKKFIDKIWDDKEINDLKISWLREPCNYYQDMDIMEYMFRGYMNADYKKITDGMYKNYSTIKGEESITEKGSYDRYSVDILKYFPFKIIDHKSLNWCREYQNLLFGTDNNCEIFSIDKELSNENITRYGYMKSRKIYLNLLESDVENSLLMEMTLGFMLNNQVYKYVKEIKEKEDLDKINNIIEILCKIPYICIRNSLAANVFDYLIQKKILEENKEEELKKIEDILEKAVAKIKIYFVDLLKIICFYSANDSETTWRTRDEEKKLYNNLQENLGAWWRNYCDDRICYEDYLEEFGLTELEDFAVVLEKEKAEKLIGPSKLVKKLKAGEEFGSDKLKHLAEQMERSKWDERKYKYGGTIIYKIFNSNDRYINRILSETNAIKKIAENKFDDALCDIMDKTECLLKEKKKEMEIEKPIILSVKKINYKNVYAIIHQRVVKCLLKEILQYKPFILSKK